MKLTKKSLKILVTLITTILVTLYGLDKANVEPVNKIVEQNQPGFYTVSRIDDGDTITVFMDGREERIRMIGVDTPETKHPEKPVQCFGYAASDFTKNIIGSQKVRLEADPESSNRDIYQRLLRYVYLPDNRLVNAVIVESGYGFAYTRFPFIKLEEFRHLEEEARQNNRGLWSNCQIEEKDTNKETAPAN